ncbi:MAG TPA: hypothetical protein VGC79_34960 [Polyangiaceae bacterium]
MPASAQSSADSAAAQGLFDEAKALMAAGKAAEACPKLEESQRLDPGGGTLLNLALCYEKIGRLASAWSRNLDAAAAAKATGNSARESAARKRAAALATRVSKLQINVASDVNVPGLELTRDGEPVGAAQWGVAIPADAGEHSIVAKAPGFKEWRASATIKGEGTRSSIDVPHLEPEPAPPPVPLQPEPVAAAAVATVPPPDAPPEHAGLGTQKIVALVAGGVGVVGLGVGIAFGIKSKSEHDESNKTCSGSDCTDPEGIDAGLAAHRSGNVATVASIIGIAGLACGTVLWLTAPTSRKDASAAALRVGIGPGTVQAWGSF